ncbi:MAG: S9 family peptidase [Anaerolineae bacterium]|nr:S9 family peptidase [Anaerolineae bacterium]
MLELGQPMSQHGINSLTFNYQGTHQSEGTYSLRNTLKDIQAAIEYLHQDDVINEFKIDTGRLILGGYSYGGGMALAYAASHPEINRIVSIAGTDHGEFAREYIRNSTFAEMIDASFEEMKFPAGPVHFGGKEVIPKLTQDPDPYDLRLSAVALANRDILLIGGWDDPNVSIEHHILPLYRALVASNALRVRVIAFQDDHAFEKSRGELAHIVADWILSV